jgi:hypothetical protein
LVAEGGTEMAVYENPNNGYREGAGLLSIVWTLLFGSLYLAYKGAWGWAFIMFIVVLGGGAVSFGVLAPILWLVFAPFAPIMIEQSYLRRGWIRVE